MSNTWKTRLDRTLCGGEVAGLYFTTALLIVVEFCFVYWLNQIQIPDAANAGSGFIVVPPWYRKPRFEVTLLLTILAGLLFSVCWGLWSLWQRRTDAGSWRRQFSRSSSGEDNGIVAALTAFDLALVTWLRS
jgi:hypothetical protein